MGEQIFLWILVISSVVTLFCGIKGIRKEKDKLSTNSRKEKIDDWRTKQKKHYIKIEKKIKKARKKNMSKNNIQFNAYAQANERMKMLIESFCENFEVDMHEYEKNLFCIAYERGYADGQFDLKKSLQSEE